ncbi:MAG: primosomal protein N' [Armatimonadetes bacterium]|nr:primosomal protein N' [Armatimonadota bacterium]
METRATASMAVVSQPGLQVLDVVFDVRVAGKQDPYTYGAVEGVSIGDLVVAPLGPRTVVGLVIGQREVSEVELGFPASSLKPVVGKIEGAAIPAPVMELLHLTAESTLCSLAECVGLVMPPGLRDRLVTRWKLTGAADCVEAATLPPAQLETLRTLRDLENGLTESKQKPITAGAKRQLRALKRLGLVEEVLSVLPSSARGKLAGALRLNPDSELIERFLKEKARKRPAMAMTLMELQGAEGTSFSAHEIKAMAGVSDATVGALVTAGLLQQVDELVSRRVQAPDPNQDQAAAITSIVHAVQAHQTTKFLLYGVTGSGKTEVFLRSAEAALKSGRQILFLVPEIALTAQVIGQLRSRFGSQVAVLHSNLSPQDRLSNWMRIASGEAPIVLGARSALFSPLANLGLIVLDEEHEASYKQENSPRYQARELALKLAEISTCPIVLGSATPSIESFFRAQQGEFELLRLPKRAASAQLPTVHVQDLAELYREGRPSLFSPLLREKIETALERSEQTILFLNRRAFAPFLVCRDCGHQFVCPNCAVTLSYHKRVGKLRCHHCGYEQAAPETCASCGGEKVAPFGAGAEKVEEAVSIEFPQARVARLDRDVVARKGALEEILTGFRGEELDILVGTQMVAKGLDFPKVTVVGVIAADISLNLPDFRASERTFQLLSQVAGRAGRSEHAGEVVIQTMNPHHVAVECAAEHDYERFYQSMIEERRWAHYPPFSQLVNLVFSGENRPVMRRFAEATAMKIRALSDEWLVLGPVDCALERLNSQWRDHVLVKIPVGQSAAKVREALGVEPPPGVQMIVDVDPYSML